LLFEPSGGSTAARKLIPYTKGLKREFLQGLWPWLLDLDKNFPRLKHGQLYFSITPVAAENGRTRGGIPVGFADDTEYLGRLGAFFVGRKFCVPAAVKNIRNMDEFMYRTLFHLLKARDLRFISVWNPTFLTLLMDQFAANREQLTRDVAAADKDRAREISNAGTDGLWPDLEVISCWADGNAKPMADKAQKLFPRTYIQPKGLLATEGIMTVPVEGLGKKLTSAHFFEFEDDAGNVTPQGGALQPGRIYDIILTTSGGFYRYKIGDRVQYRGKDCFDFVGKGSHVSDYFGEKLNESHVCAALRDLSCEFCMLAPRGDGYVLYVDEKAEVSRAFAAALDTRLRENFHYDYCRRLGQLRDVAVFRIKGDAHAQHARNCVARGQRLGDVKNLCLSNKDDWQFEGSLL
ncbi:MAG: GH3 auxin-responsive promoter family protein, partial [Clostridiales Family XIII bacterium]|nr:GH3 auxin-responsive promoter family protein [Clostridiales Family XIII bacterium]